MRMMDPRRVGRPTGRHDGNTVINTIWIVVKRTIYVLLISALAAAVVLPIIITVMYSFMERNELIRHLEAALSSGGGAAGGVNGGMAGGVSFIPWPVRPDFKQYCTMLIESLKFNRAFWKSFEYSALIAVGQIVIGTMAAFAFSAFRFRGRDALFFIFIAAMMMPFQVTMVPNFIALRAFGIIGTEAAIILPGIFSAFGVFVLRQFMVHIPVSVIEAAQIDGASTYSVFFRIILPLGRSGIAALIVLSFIDTWNMVEQPLVFLSDMAKMPLSILIREAMEQARETVFAPGVLFMLPAVFLFLVFERALVDGIETGWGKI